MLRLHGLLPVGHDGSHEVLGPPISETNVSKKDRIHREGIKCSHRGARRWRGRRAEDFCRHTCQCEASRASMKRVKVVIATCTAANGDMAKGKSKRE